jgi:hypothetical protein
MGLTAYQGAEQLLTSQGRQQLLHPSQAMAQSSAEQSALASKIAYGGQDVSSKQAAGQAYFKAHGRMPNVYAQWVSGKGPMPVEFLPESEKLGPAGAFTMAPTAYIVHRDGTKTQHPLVRVGPNNYEIPGDVRMLPGDEIQMDGFY